MPVQVTLVNPNRMQPAVGPIGLDYIAEALADAGHKVDLLDLCFEPDQLQAITRYFQAHRPDLIGLSIRNTDDCYFASRESFLAAYRDIYASLEQQSAAPILLGGAGFSVMPEAVLRKVGAQYGIVGDGEQSTVTVADAIDRGGSWLGTAGLVYRQGDDFHRNPSRFASLDNPARGRRYVDNPRYLLRGGMGNLETKRGCGQRCVYCADPLSKGHEHRLRHPKLVADEIEVLLAQGVDVLHFCDSEFNLPYEHAMAICAELVRRHLSDRIGWYTYAAVQPFDGALARMMIRAGCRGVNFGADSGDDRMLTRLGHAYRAADVRTTAETCHRAHLNFMYDLLLGGPGETKETVRTTIELMQTIRPARVGAALGVRVYPGTPLAAMVLGEGFRSENPNLHGTIVENDDCAEPVFYLSASLGEDGNAYLRNLIGSDPRFLVGAPKADVDRNYNYNDNSRLVDAINRGCRGAYWDILRKLDEGTQA